MIPGNPGKVQVAEESKLKNSGEALEVGQANSSFTSVRAGDVSNRSLSLLAPWELKVKLNFNFNFYPKMQIQNALKERKNE